MKSLYLFLITTTVFISTSKFAYADERGFLLSLKNMSVFFDMKFEQLREQEGIDSNTEIDALNNNNSLKEGIDPNVENPTQKKDD